MPISVSKNTQERRIITGLWSVFAVIFLSVIYLLSNMGIDNVKIAIIVAMLTTIAMLFNRGSRRLLIVPAIITLLCSLAAFVLQHHP
ncbi:DUF1435 family protein [Providencia sneebia]|uniref:DUF1435 domain-containing protein n=1 Tax=Providencia sneebia DSM 19967 TaxID=1141660 RepID=K8WBL7_9GAMM|nr:hypothetical protein OO7_15584 [Providencia sneebia DSM 19967]